MTSLKHQNYYLIPADFHLEFWNSQESFENFVNLMTSRIIVYQYALLQITRICKEDNFTQFTISKENCGSSKQRMKT